MLLAVAALISSGTAAAQTGPRFAPLATGQVTSVSPDRLVLVTDRDMNAGLRKGTALTFVLTAETRILELDGRRGFSAADVAPGRLANVRWVERDGRLVATEVGLRPGRGAGFAAAPPSPPRAGSDWHVSWDAFVAELERRCARKYSSDEISRWLDGQRVTWEGTLAQVGHDPPKKPFAVLRMPARKVQVGGESAPRAFDAIQLAFRDFDDWKRNVDELTLDAPVRFEATLRNSGPGGVFPPLVPVSREEGSTLFLFTVSDPAIVR